VITDHSSLHDAACNLLSQISNISDSLFQRKSPPTDRDLLWLSQKCSLACAALKTCHWHQRWHQSMVLRMTIRDAKCAWVDKLIDNPDVSIWDMAKWCKGHWLKDIPPIHTEEGISHDADLMSTVFLQRFFLITHDNPKPLSLLSPRSLPMRPLRTVREDEIHDALHHTSNDSTPRPSGIGYLLLKWAFEALPSLFTLLFSSALQLELHPWGDTLMVIIPKPGKSDYMLAKAYRPISLLECCGKLLEKVIALRFSWEVDHLGLINDCQFGSYHHYLAPDTTLSLQYKASEMIRHGRIGAVLLFDIFQVLQPSRPWTYD
jgi:hypothetical protein